MHRRIVMLIGLLVAIGPLAAVFPGLVGGALADGACIAAASSGLTALIVAHTGQQISGTFDATGCDVGIYVGPGVTGVVISRATITGAAVHAIYVQDTQGVLISGNTIIGNEPNGEQSFSEAKAITVAGSSNVMVLNNLVTDNGGGGISINDDGPFKMATSPNGGSLNSAMYNLVANNTVVNNTNGCGIVVSTYNAGQQASRNVVRNNFVENNPAGIVIATDLPFTTVDANQVVGNTTANDAEAGIVLHANSPGDRTTDTLVALNTVGVDASGIGILIQITPPGLVSTPPPPAAVLANNLVLFNTISGPPSQPVPILRDHDTGTVVFGNHIQ